ncbi:MAG: sugar phosphate isomerase/epimerase, partial [Verrucomicrobiales bacterium]|nr:sugar phosphate isomerase/epimerase [Verrucomicrobiales bacterium]
GVTFPAPNLFQFSAEAPRERELAVRYTLKTLEFATRVGAPAVVLHLGSVDMKDYTSRLKRLVESGEKDSPRYEKLCAEATSRREAKKEKFVERTYETLRRILPEAQARGLKLGVENREALEEIPLETDFPFLFREFDGAPLGYWHDTGHAQIKENLGLIHHALHLESLADRLVGFHIHDTQFPARDHCAPGTGTVNFAALKPFVRPEHIKVFEFSPTVTREDALRGIAHVKAIWGED